jgi:hypothetical protein
LGPALDLVFRQGKHNPDPRAIRAVSVPGKADSTRRLRAVYREISDASDVASKLLIEAGKLRCSGCLFLRPALLVGGRNT